ncbi:MAG: CBS domain-containing protein [Nitrospira sp.]|jgi:CBS domain-containing protein|nr:CBS domain-containing protein [Nitrospira sp.]
MTGLAGQQVSAYMHRQLELVSQEATIVETAVRMRERSLGSVLVESLDRQAPDCRIVGILTETDLVRKVLAHGLDADQTSAGRVMASPLLTIAPDHPMVDASHLMETHKVRHLGVSDGTDIIGMISVRDLVKYFVEAESGAARALDNVYRPLSVLMRTVLETLGSEETVAAAAKRMADKRIGSLFVIEAGEMVGIVTESDLVRKGIALRLDAHTVRVGALMNSPLLAIDINRTIRDASDLMAKKRVRHLAVTENAKIVGVLSIRDLVKMVSVRDRPEFLRR